MTHWVEVEDCLIDPGASSASSLVFQTAAVEAAQLHSASWKISLSNDAVRHQYVKCIACVVVPDFVFLTAKPFI